MHHGLAHKNARQTLNTAFQKTTMTAPKLINGFEVVIGFETHVQLRTKSKIFSRAPTAFGAEPNTQACALDMALPGTLPVMNREAVACAIRFGLALGSKIAPRSIFARKNYFYPDLPKGYAFVGQAMKLKSIMGFWTLLIAHVTFNLPYVILSVQPKLLQMDENLTEAALDLGCTPMRAFWKVILPEIMPGVVSGLLMSFAMSLDDFVISYFVYGPNFVTLPVEIYNYTKKPLHPKIYALFTLLFLAILVVMTVMNLLQARDSAKQRGSRLSRSRKRADSASGGN